MNTNHHKGSRQILKRLMVDALMGILFLSLLAFSIWVFWIYFFRGPIDIETRGFVSRTIRLEDVEPVDVEKYRIRHFHNLDDVVVAGIQSGSLCVECHSDYPHKKDKKTRSFFNAHSWFMACETCHSKPEQGEKFEYRWLEFNTGNPMASLEGQSGVYGGMIVPIRKRNGDETRVDKLSKQDQEYTEEFIRLGKNLDEYQIEMANKRIHEPLAKQALFCDNCHTSKGVLRFDQLLYSADRSRHLESLNMASMVSTYEEFHLPSVFDQSE